MKYKELGAQEVAKMLAEKGLPIRLYVSDNPERDGWREEVVTAIDVVDSIPFGIDDDRWYRYCAIRVEPKMRLMTQEECIAWSCTDGASEWQVSFAKEIWRHPGYWEYSDNKILNYKRRTVKRNNGKLEYGKPEKLEIEE